MMRKLKKIVAGTLVLSMAFITSCATTPGPAGECYWSSPTTCIAANTAGGAAIGAATGALIGALTGGGTKGATTGAIAGGVAGGLMAFAIAWGKCFACFTKIKSEPTKDYATTQKELSYSPQQGVAAKINQYSLTPSAVAPGDTIKFVGNYHIMFPPDKKEMSVTETAILKVYNDKTQQFEEVGRAGEDVVVSPGSRKANTEILIPDNADEGKFMIAFMVKSDDKSDTVEMPFIVTKDRAKLEKAQKESMDAMATQQKQGTPTNVANNTATQSGVKSIQQASSKYLIILPKKVNLRENPETKAKIISSAKQNEKYQILNNITVGGKKWYQVALTAGRTAWVVETAVRPMEE